MSDDDAQRASLALQQLAAGLDEGSPQPAVSASDRSQPAWSARHATPSARPRPLR